MRNIKQYIANIETQVLNYHEQNLNKAIWEMTMYSPKFPLREHQNQLLSLATQSQIEIFDSYFSQQLLNINVYKWGNGKTKIFITHGWGSKAADFNDLIARLLHLDVEIIAFDAPGNGLSDGTFSCLPLYAESIEKIISVHGRPHIMIGHSLGALANLLYLNQNESIKPILVSIAPFVNLKHYFSSNMNNVNVGNIDKEIWFESFEARFNKKVEQFNFIEIYNKTEIKKHVLAFDTNDKVTPYEFLEPLIEANSNIDLLDCTNSGHEKIIKDISLINSIAELVR